jgi:hypothetical protein
MRMKQKVPKWQTQKTEIFKTANSRNFVAKISWIGPWISSID